MEILRIPITYSMQIQNLPDKDIAYVMKTIFSLSNGEIIKIENSIRGGIVLGMWREAVQMENRARSKKGEKWLKQDNATLTGDIDGRHNVATEVAPNSIQETSIQEKSRKETIPSVGEQALVPIDHRNKGTQRIIDIIKNQVEQEGYLYDNNREERNRATIIAKRQSDWGYFIGDTPEDREEEVIRQIISFSNQNEYTSKIRSAKDFHEKWKRVANAMKQKATQPVSALDIIL